jgi:hypothetical protein
MLDAAMRKQIWPGYDVTSRKARAREEARQLYHGACGRGWLHRMLSVLTRRVNHLLKLAEIEASSTLRNSHHIGMQTVPIDQIRGSVGRYHDFDSAFCPLKNHLSSRWLRVATARQMGITLPLVRLIQVGDVYFVKDGHHRISVARALGQQYMEADVEVWQVTGSLPWERADAPA